MSANINWMDRKVGIELTAVVFRAAGGCEAGGSRRFAIVSAKFTCCAFRHAGTLCHLISRRSLGELDMRLTRQAGGGTSNDRPD